MKLVVGLKKKKIHFYLFSQRKEEKFPIIGDEIFFFLCYDNSGKVVLNEVY